MKFEKQKIYRKKNKEGTYSYLLVFNTTKFGMTYAYLAPPSEKFRYGNIDGIWFDDKEFDGYVSIERTMYIGWSKINSSFYEKVYDVPYRKYSAITTAIKQLFDGTIIAKDGAFYYCDEVEIDDTTSIVKNNVDMINTNNITVNVEIKEVDTPVSDNIVSPEINVSIKHDRVDFNTETELVDTLKEYNIPIDEDISCAESDGIKYYNLTEKNLYDRTKSTGDRNGTINMRCNKKRSSTTNINRSMFSSDEVLAISVMNYAAVMSKYNVSRYIAGIMIHNAKIIAGFDMNDDTITYKHNFVSMFDQGYSIEDVAKMYPDVPEFKVRESYYVYECNKNSDNNKTVSDKWDEIIKAGDFITMVNAMSGGVRDFCRNEKCSVYVGRDLFYKLNDILSFNPYYSAGFGSIAFDAQALSKFIDDMKHSKKAKDRAALFVYEKTTKLSDAYAKSYNNHADILAGIKEIPEYVDIEDRVYFMDLLWNRFSPHHVINSSRILTNEQKKILESNNSTIEDIAMIFMIPYKKARSIKTNKARYKK